MLFSGFVSGGKCRIKFPLSVIPWSVNIQLLQTVILEDYSKSDLKCQRKSS